MPNTIVPLLESLIRIPSVTADTDALQNVTNFIQNWWGDSGSIQSYSYNNHPSLLINLNPNTLPEIILNGHADVVPARPDQFTPTVKSDRLYGRGAQDMKSGLAVMLTLLKDLKSQKKHPPLALMIVTDEETGGFDGTKKLLHQLKLHPKLFISGESTDLKIENQAKGVLWLKIKTVGKRAHGAYPWEGKNAISKLAQEITALSHIFPELTEFAWSTTCNFGKISGGLAANQVPSEAEATLDIRRVPQDPSPSILSRIKEGLVFPDTQVETLLDEPEHDASPSEPALQKLAQAITKVTGHKAEFVQKCGASDARHFSAQGIPAVCFGPTGSGLHTDEEWVSLDSLSTYYDALHHLVIS